MPNICTTFETDENQKDSIETTFANNNLQRGNYTLFQIKKKIEICYLDLNSYEGHTGTLGYYKKMDINNPNDFPAPINNTTGPGEGGWTQFINDGSTVPTGRYRITFNPKVVFEPGYYAFLIITADNRYLSYTDGTSVNVIYQNPVTGIPSENDAIGIYEGWGVRYGYTEEVINQQFSPRVFNIYLEYNILSSSNKLFLYILLVFLLLRYYKPLTKYILDINRSLKSTK